MSARNAGGGFDPWVGKFPWRRKWQPILVFLLRESHRRRSLVVYSPWGRKESETTDGFRIGKGVQQGCMLSPCLFNLYAEYFIRNARLDKAQAEIKIARRNTSDLRYADDNTLMAENKELKSLLMRVKEESGKAGLKLSIQKTKIMTSSPISSWQIEWEKVEAVTDFIFLGSKITADGDCSHEIKRHLLLGRKAMTNLDSILKSGNITLLTKVCIVKAVVFQ